MVILGETVGGGTAELIYVIYVLNVHIKRSVCQNTWLSLICSLITFLTWEVILWCFIKEEREPICLILFYDVKWGINEDAIKQVAQKLSLRHTCNTTVHVSCIPYAVDDLERQRWSVEESFQLVWHKFSQKLQIQVLHRDVLILHSLWLSWGLLIRTLIFCPVFDLHNVMLYLTAEIMCN